MTAPEISVQDIEMDDVVLFPVFYSDAATPIYSAQQWRQYRNDSGGAGKWPYRIQGTCKDSVGVAVGNATVRLFKTSDNVLQQTSTSVPDSYNLGAYGFGVLDNSTAYYVVAYRSGPDIMGTTQNNLTGA